MNELERFAVATAERRAELRESELTAERSARIEELEARIAELAKERDAAIASRAAHEKETTRAMAKMRGDKSRLRARVEELKCWLHQRTKERDRAEAALSAPPVVPEGFEVIEEDGMWLLVEHLEAASDEVLSPEYRRMLAVATRALAYAIERNECPPHAAPHAGAKP